MPLDDAANAIADQARRILDNGDRDAPPFEVEEVEGVRLASNGKGQFVGVMPDVTGEVRVFKRRAVKGLGSASPYPAEWLVVVELPSGIRVYVADGRVVLTRVDVNP